MMKTFIRSLCLLSLLVASSASAVIDAYWSSLWGPPWNVYVVSNSLAATTYAMAGLNTGWSARHVARTVLDVKAIKVHWSAAATPGVVSIFYETDDATTGKPTGTLYDAAATLTGQVPAAGVQTYTFAVLPTTGRTVGLAYHVVILTTTAGTTQTLYSYVTGINPTPLPSSVLTAADGTTRSNFAEVAGSTPTVILVMEDDSEVSLEEGLTPFTTGTVNSPNGNSAAALKIVLPVAMTVGGIEIVTLQKAGTPAGDLRLRVFDSADSVVTGTTVTVDKEHILVAAGTRGMTVRFPAPVLLAAGTYRLVADCASCANSSNCWRIASGDAMDAATVPTAWQGSTTSDLTAGPIVWTDSTTKIMPMRLMITNIAAPAGGVGIIGG